MDILTLKKKAIPSRKLLLDEDATSIRQPGEKPYGDLGLVRDFPTGLLFVSEKKALLGGNTAQYYGSSAYKSNRFYTPTIADADIYFGLDDNPSSISASNSVVVVLSGVFSSAELHNSLYRGTDEGGYGWNIWSGLYMGGSPRFHVVATTAPNSSTGAVGLSSYGLRNLKIGELFTIVGKWEPGVGTSIWVNGVKGVSVATTSSYQYLRLSDTTGGRGRGWTLGRNSDGSPRHGDVGLFGCFNGAHFTDDECLELSRDPYAGNILVGEM